MADGIKLSRDLIDNLLRVVGEHDPQAQQDMVVSLQYLCAVTGYLAADYPGPDNEREELLEHLHAFTKHVCDDRAKEKQSPPQQAAAPVSGRSEPTSDPAVGIWKPD